MLRVIPFCCALYQIVRSTRIFLPAKENYIHKNNKEKDDIKKKNKKEKSTIKSLPNEILQDIVSFLPGPDKMVCQMVCKSWYVIAKPLFYQSVTIEREYHAHRSLSFLELPETNIGIYVKDLTIKRPRGESRNKNKGKLPPFGTRASSTRLFTRCPNLTRAIVDGCNPYYMLLSLKHAPKLGVQLDLKEIQINKSGYDNPAVQKMYYSANLQNAATITQLYVFDDFFSIRWPEHQQQYNNSLYTYLSQFGKLEALTPLHIKYIINTFPYLEKLYIYPLFRIDWSSEEEKMQIVGLFESYSAKLKDTNFRIDLS